MEEVVIAFTAVKVKIRRSLLLLFLKLLKFI